MPRTIPSHYERVELPPASPEKLIAIVDWIMSSGVLTRGVIHENNNGISRGTELVGETAYAQQLLWSVYRSGIETMRNYPTSPEYQAIFHFHDVRDAIEFKILFDG
jgi:hypothetical protein